MELKLLDGESREFTELQVIAYREIIVLVSTGLEVRERNVNATDCMALDDRISYSLLSHRRVGCVTYQHYYMTLRYFHRHGFPLVYHSSIVPTWKLIFKSKLFCIQNPVYKLYHKASDKMLS